MFVFFTFGAHFFLRSDVGHMFVFCYFKDMLSCALLACLGHMQCCCYFLDVGWCLAVMALVYFAFIHTLLCIFDMCMPVCVFRMFALRGMSCFFESVGVHGSRRGFLVTAVTFFLLASFCLLCYMRYLVACVQKFGW